MRMLIVDDDQINRKLMHRILQPYGDIDEAIDGREAMEAFSKAFLDHRRYDLVCLDIMMPVMNGHEVLSSIRKFEEENGIHGLDGVRVIMTTALSDSKTILSAFRSQCEAYVVKPIDRRALIKQIQDLGLIEEEPCS